MDNRYPRRFARQHSDNKYIQNDHFLHHNTQQLPKDELNMT